ncbi:hypothetical protein D3C77_372800 [compost metagenome]
MGDELLGDFGRRKGRPIGDLKVVRDLQGNAVDDLDAFVLDVINDQPGQWLHVGRKQGHLLRPQRLDAFDQGAGTGDHRGGGVVLYRTTVQASLRLPVITQSHAHDGDQTGVAQHVNARVREFQRAAITVVVHALELLSGHVFHPHAAGVEGETFRVNAFPDTQHLRNFSLHGRVRAGDNLANTDDLANFHELHSSANADASKPSVAGWGD